MNLTDEAIAEIVVDDEKEKFAKAVIELQWHKDFVEVCSCEDGDYDCWYRLSPEEQRKIRIEHIKRQLAE